MLALTVRLSDAWQQTRQGQLGKLAKRTVLMSKPSQTTTSATIQSAMPMAVLADAERKQKGLACMLGGAMVHLTLGTVYCWGNFISYAPQSLQYFDGKPHPGSPSDALAAIPLNFIIQALVMPFSPAISRHLGASKTTLLGSWLIAFAVYMASFQTDLASFLLFYSILFGMGIGLSYTVPMAAGWKWLPEYKGLVSGGILTGLGAGGFLFSLIGSKTANPLGLNQINGKFDASVYAAFPMMLRRLAMIYAVLSFVGSMLITEPAAQTAAVTAAPADAAPPAAAAAPSIAANGLTVKQALSSSQFWLMWVMIICSATAGLNTVAIYKQFAATSVALRGDQYLALVGGIAALCNGSGRLLWGYLTDRIGFKSCYQFVTVLQSLLLVSYPFSTWSPLAFAANTCGMVFCLAGNLALMPSATQRMFGPLSGTTIYGILYSAFAIAGVVGGILTKMLVRTYGWTTVFRTMTVMSLMATMLVRRLFPVKEYAESTV